MDQPKFRVTFPFGDKAEPCVTFPDGDMAETEVFVTFPHGDVAEPKF